MKLLFFLIKKNKIRKKRFDEKNKIRRKRVARETNFRRLLKKQKRFFKCYHVLNKRENDFIIQKQRVFVTFDKFEIFEIFHESSDFNLKSIFFVVKMFDEIISSLFSKKIN